MEAILYKTDLLPDYSRIMCGNISDYLSGVPSLTVVLPNVNVGALELALTFQSIDDADVAAFNYANIGGKYYFLADWKKATSNAYTVTASFDHFHNYDSINVTGDLVSAHDLGDVIYDSYYAEPEKRLSREYAQITYPIQPTCGDFLRTFAWGMEQNPVSASVVCHLTIFQDNVERDTIIFSPPASIINERTVLAATIGNYGRIKTLSNNEVKSVNKIWLIPWEFVSVSGEPTATATFGGGVGSINVYWHTQQYNQGAFLGNKRVQRFFLNSATHEIIPLFLRVGNLGSYIDMPLTCYRDRPVVQFRMDAYAGDIDLNLYYQGVKIDLLPSVSAPFSASRINEREASRNLSNAIAIVGSLISVGAGIAATVGTGGLAGVAAIGGGAAGLATTGVKMATAVHSTQTTVEGQVFVNCMPLVYGDGTPNETFNCFSIMGYTVANNAEFTAALEQYGYVGKWGVKNFDVLTERANSSVANTWAGDVGFSFTYNGTYRRFADNSRLIIDDVPTESRAVIRDVLTRGTTFYYNNTIEPVKINWFVNPVWGTDSE